MQLRKTQAVHAQRCCSVRAASKARLPERPTKSAAECITAKQRPGTHLRRQRPCRLQLAAQHCNLLLGIVQRPPQLALLARQLQRLLRHARLVNLHETKLYHCTKRRVAGQGSSHPRRPQCQATPGHACSALHQQPNRNRPAPPWRTPCPEPRRGPPPAQAARAPLPRWPAKQRAGKVR